MFDPNAPLDANAIATAKTFRSSLPALPSGSFFTHVYLHWAVAHFNCLFADYNAMIDLEHGMWVQKITHDPLTNARDSEVEAMHTYHRNGHAFGIAIGGMWNATPENFGQEGVQQHEIEHLCATAAAVCLAYNLDASGKTPQGEFVIMTHAEAAIADGYFPGDGDPDSRWDLARLVASTAPLSKDEAHETADVLRQRIHRYKIALAA